MIPPKLHGFLMEHQKPSIEQRFVRGDLFAWCMHRYAQFFMRRMTVAVFFSIRYFLLALAFVWFSWGDLIFFTSIVALGVGFHFGSLESYRKLAQSKVKVSPQDIKVHLGMTRIVTWGVVFFLVSYFLVVSRHGFVKGYHVNVFDFARFLIVARGISQIFRSLNIAYQSKKGMLPIPMRWLWLMESALVVFFIGMIQFVGRYPSVLGWTLLIETVFSEIVMWKWLFLKRKMRERYLPNLKDIGLFFLFLKNKSMTFLFDTASGTFLYAERFILAAFMYRAGLHSPVAYFLILPMTVLAWRSPHFFSRYFRSHQSMLRRKIGLNILAIVFLATLSMGILIFLIFQKTPMLYLAHAQKMAWVLILLGPVSTIFAYIWYSNVLSRILGILKKTVGYQPLYVEFTKNVPQHLPASALPQYGRVYLFWVRRKKLELLKNQLFALSLGNIRFFDLLKHFQNEILGSYHAAKKIHLGSILIKKYIRNDEDAEYALKKIKKSIQDGKSKSWIQNGYQFKLILNTFRWPTILIQKND